MTFKVHVVIPVFNGKEHTLQTVKSLCTMLPPGCEIVIIDDGSTDGTGEALHERFPFVRVLPGDGSLWWSGGINRGAKYALDHDADYVLFMNNDIVLHPLFFEELMQAAREFPDALIASKILNADEPWKIWSMGGKYNWLTGSFWMLGCGQADDGRWNEPVYAEWLPGMSVLVPMAVFRQGIWVDEKAFPQYSGDSDHSIRARQAGFPLIVWPRSIVYNKVRNSGVTTKLLLGLERPSLRLLKEALTSIKSSAAINTFGRLVFRHAPVWSWPLTLGRFYGFFFLKVVQVALKIPGPRRWINKRRFASFARHQQIGTEQNEGVADNIV